MSFHTCDSLFVSFDEIGGMAFSPDGESAARRQRLYFLSPSTSNPSVPPPCSTTLDYRCSNLNTISSDTTMYFGWGVAWSDVLHIQFSILKHGAAIYTGVGNIFFPWEVYEAMGSRTFCCPRSFSTTCQNRVAALVSPNFVFNLCY